MRVAAATLFFRAAAAARPCALKSSFSNPRARSHRRAFIALAANGYCKDHCHSILRETIIATTTVTVFGTGHSLWLGALRHK
jgi:hypothetical protein